MNNKTITRLLSGGAPGGSPGGGMTAMAYISADDVVEGTAEERGHLFFTSATGEMNVGVWECTPCTERMRDYPFDQCCFVLEGTVTIIDQSEHAETFGPGDAFVIPRGFSGDWRMSERYRNFFVTVEPATKEGES